MIAVSGIALVVVVVLGVLAYLHDGAKKVREMKATKAAKDRLNTDLQAPRAQTQLPYGISSDPEPEPEPEPE